MKFLKSLGNALKRKEGGTVVGNILRKVANTQSGGVLGNGALMIKQGQTKQENTRAFVDTLKGAFTKGLDAGASAAAESYVDSTQPSASWGFMDNVKEFWHNHKGMIIGIPAAITALVITVKLLFRNKNKKG